MKNQNDYIEPDGNQEVREIYTVRVSTFQEFIFHFCIYLLFGILTVFVLLGLM